MNAVSCGFITVNEFLIYVHDPVNHKDMVKQRLVDSGMLPNGQNQRLVTNRFYYLAPGDAEQALASVRKHWQDCSVNGLHAPPLSV